MKTIYDPHTDNAPPDNLEGRILSDIGARVSNVNRYWNVVRTHFELDQTGELVWRRHPSHRWWLDATLVDPANFTAEPPIVKLQVPISPGVYKRRKFNLREIYEALHAHARQE